MSGESFVAVHDLDVARHAFGVVGAAGQEAADDELVDTPLIVVGERLRRGVGDGVDGRVGFVVVPALARGLEASAVDEVLGEGAPASVLGLFPDERAQVHAAVEAVGFGARVADEALVVELFRHCHGLLTRHAQEAGCHLLELDGGEREGFELASGFGLDFGHGREARNDAPFVEDDGHHPVEEAVPRPGEVNLDSVALVHHFDGPERLGDEVLDAEVPVDDEA